MGEAVLQNYVETLKWFDLAAISGEAKSMERRDGLARRMTPEGVSKAQQLARRFLEERDKDSQTKVSRTRPSGHTYCLWNWILYIAGWIFTDESPRNR